MAVENKYSNSDIAAGKRVGAVFAAGSELQVAQVTIAVAAGDDDGSIYRAFKGLNPEMIPIKIELLHAAITGATDYDLGFYNTDLGAVIDKDNLADGLDFSSGTSKDGMAAVALANHGKKLWELAGHTVANKKASYDLAITANTVGSAAGTIVAKLYYVQG